MSDEAGRPEVPDDVTGAQADPPPVQEDAPPTSHAQEPSDDDDTEGNGYAYRQIGVDLD